MCVHYFNGKLNVANGTLPMTTVPSSAEFLPDTVHKNCTKMVHRSHGEFLFSVFTPPLIRNSINDWQLGHHENETILKCVLLTKSLQ